MLPCLAIVWYRWHNAAVIQTFWPLSLLASSSSNILLSLEKSPVSFVQDSANKVSRVLWLAKSSKLLGPVMTNCQYCKRCYGYGYQDHSQHDVSWMNEPEPGAGSYVNLMRCWLVKETYSDYCSCYKQILHREACSGRDRNHYDKAKAVQQVCKRN